MLLYQFQNIITKLDDLVKNQFTFTMHLQFYHTPLNFILFYFNSIIENCEVEVVKDLFLEDGSWNIPLICSSFLGLKAEQIIQFPIINFSDSGIHLIREWESAKVPSSCSSKVDWAFWKKL